jgi:uncharacterized protein YbaR (Trm112 family)
MRADFLEILRCPYCGGTLELVLSSCHRVSGDEIEDGILACHCCTFPIVAGIPVMHLDAPAKAAREHIEAGRSDLARGAMTTLEPAHAASFQAVVDSRHGTYRDAVDALGPEYERGYFLYRFSDPSFVVAHPLVRAIARTVLAGGRAIDLCGGSGHLTRSLMDLSAPEPVVADLYFVKLLLARRFTAPGCEAVCCNANAPLPFARGAFRFALCADAFMFVWHKRQFVREMLRLIGDGARGEAAVITHTHNQLQWSPSLGNPLPPDGYRDLFETLPARLFAESTLFADIVSGRPIDLMREHPPEALAADQALEIVASGEPRVFASHAVDWTPGAAGELRINPLYAVEERADGLNLRLTFPSQDYADEFGAVREYLPEKVVLEPGTHPPELVKRRVILDLPRDYY